MSKGGVLNVLGNALIPETMARFRDAENALVPQIAQSQLLGGLDPSTGIVWNQGRPMDDATAKATAARAFPEQARAALIKQYFPDPAEFMAPVAGVDEAGNPIFFQPSKTGQIREVAGVAPPPSRESSREQKITEYMDLYGLDRASATKAADGLVQLYTDPFTGNTQVFDRVATVEGGSERPPSGPSGQQESPAGGQNQTDSRKAAIDPVLADVTKFGVRGAFPEALQSTVGQFGLYSADSGTIQQRQKYRLLRETVLDAYARSGKPSNYAQQRIEELLPSTGFFESPEGAWDKIKVLHDQLKQQVEDDEAVIRDQSYPIDIRREAKASVSSARRALRMIGDPSQYPRPNSTAAGGVTPPQAAVNALKANPARAAEFDAKYGAGAAKKALGVR